MGPPSRCCIAVLTALAVASLVPLANSTRIGGAAFLVKDDVAAPAPPKWADAYTTEFIVSMPYMYLTQPQGLSIPVKAWYDHHNKRARIDNFGGIDTVIFDTKHTYEIHPRIDKLQCWVDYEDDDTVQLTAKAVTGLLGGVVPILPDLSDWKYVGSLNFEGKAAHIWQLQYSEGLAVSTYNFYTSIDGQPLKLHMFGENMIAIGHYDEYIYDFKSYTPGPDDAAFQVPELCQSERVLRRPQGHTGWLARQASMLMPSSRTQLTTPHTAIDAAHAHWSISTKRAPAQDDTEHRQRVARFRQSLLRVSAHNAQPNKTYTMQLGRFADWSEEEYYGVLMPDAWRRMQGLPSAKQARREEALRKVPHAFDALGKFKRRMKRSQLPREVDWRGTGADSGVKDQGMCGSCWSFGATATMEGAWYLHTGEKRSFSEQALVDCAYDWGNSGCDGGDSKPAINYVAKNGGIPIEQDYYYHSTGDYCRIGNFTRVGKFEGYLQVEPRDEAALMEAVYRMGPLSIAIDPSPDAFAYYKEGVFSDKKCSIHSLDHQVILFGYGTENGIPYWLVKNTWSKFWGADGYIKIERGPNDCGIATDGVVAVVAKEMLRPGADSRRLEGVRKW